jgi:DNA-binding NarL/FixJ family response regulator
MGDDRTRRRDPSEGEPPAAPALVLLQVAGPGAPRAFALRVGEHVLGRDAGADIRIASDDVSRRHAKIVVARGALINVLDLGSTNGTFVNGSRVDLRTLQRGDAIALADARLLVADADTAKRVLALGSAEVAPPASPSLDLTDRQVDIARLVAHGLTNAEIAERLAISKRTVTSHLDHIYTRLGISSRAALVSALARAGLLALLLCANGCLAPTEDFADPRRELLVDWVFDEEAGTVVDGAPAGEDLEIQGGEWAVDEAPPHLRFDGVDDLAVGPDLQDVVPTLSTISIEALVRVDAPEDEDWTPRAIVELPQNTAEGTFALGLIAYTAANRLEFQLTAGGVNVQVNRDQGYVTGEWTVVHGVYDGAAAHLYIDGEPLVDPIPLQGMLDAHDFDFGAQTVRVGGDGTSFLPCGLARLRMWSRALPPEEVSHRAEQLMPEGGP